MNSNGNLLEIRNFTNNTCKSPTPERNANLVKYTEACETNDFIATARITSGMVTKKLRNKCDIHDV